jgi:hypothetical protein
LEMAYQEIAKKRKRKGKPQCSPMKRAKAGNPSSQKDSKHQHGRSTSTISFTLQSMDRKQSIPSSVRSRRSASPDSVLGAQSSDDDMLAAFTNHRHGSSEIPAKSLTRQTTPDSVVGDDGSDSSSVPLRRMADLKRSSVKRVTQKVATDSDTAGEESLRHEKDTRGQLIHQVDSTKMHAVEQRPMQDAPPYPMQGQSASAIQDTIVPVVLDQVSSDSSSRNSKIVRLHVGQKSLVSLTAQKTATASPSPIGHSQRTNSPSLPHICSFRSQMTPIKDMLAALNRMRAARDRERQST